MTGRGIPSRVWRWLLLLRWRLAYRQWRRSGGRVEVLSDQKPSKMCPRCGKPTEGRRHPIMDDKPDICGLVLDGRVCVLPASKAEFIPPPWWVEAMGGTPEEIELARRQGRGA